MKLYIRTWRLCSSFVRVGGNSYSMMGSVSLDVSFWRVSGSVVFDVSFWAAEESVPFVVSF